jgi:EF hand
VSPPGTAGPTKELAMTPRITLAVAALAWLAQPAVGTPPVTSTEAAPPGPAQARLWLKALFQEPLFECCPDSLPRSELVRMLSAVRGGRKLGPGVGWYGPSRWRHDWAWLAGRYDADRDGRVTRAELGGPADFFARLDRDRDGAVTAEDLDWSERSTFVREEARALRLFRAMDADGNGDVSREEWQAFFKGVAGGKAGFTPEELRQAVFPPEPGRGGKGKGKKVRPEVWLRCLLDGDLGSPFAGPAIGQEAPDFTLPAHDGKGRVTLSQFRGKRPVVLIFGSFT